MAALKRLWLAPMLAGLLAWHGSAAAEPVDRWAPQIAEAAARFGLPAEWIRQVMRAESGGRTTLAGRPIVSSAGAMGLMQLMPATWREMRAKLGLGPDPHDPRDNILAGAGYLRMMYDRFGYPDLFAGYNAGPARYERHRATGRPLPAETVAYLAAVAGGAATAARRAAPEVEAAAPGPSLFAFRADLGAQGAAPGDAGTAPDSVTAGAAWRSLFVPLRQASAD